MEGLRKKKHGLDGYTFMNAQRKDASLKDNPPGNTLTEERKKQFKKEIMEVFRKFGYLNGNGDHEVTFRTTSGNIAWININSMKIIK